MIMDCDYNASTNLRTRLSKERISAWETKFYSFNLFTSMILVVAHWDVRHLGCKQGFTR